MSLLLSFFLSLLMPLVESADRLILFMLFNRADCDFCIVDMGILAAAPVCVGLSRAETACCILD